MARKTLESPAKRRLLLSADAFLFAAALDFAITAALLGTMGLVTGSPVAIATLGAFAAAAFNAATTVVPVLGGAALAWWIRGRSLSWTAAAGAVAGMAAGGVVTAAVLGIAVLVARQVPSDPTSPPWVMIGVVGALALAFAALPIIDAAQDAKHSRRDHVALDWIRFLSIVAIAALAYFALPMVAAAEGNSLGEAGALMMPAAMASAFAALGADLLVAWSANRKDAGAGPLNA
jgi:hypothetical protein